MGATTAVADCE